MPPRSEALYQIASKAERIGDMLNGMQGADDIVFLGMGRGMLGNRLISDVGADVGLASRAVGMRFEADIGCMCQIRRQSCFATADVENFIPRANQPDNAFEFVPRNAGSTHAAVNSRSPDRV